MAIGFSYTLTPNESESMTRLQEFLDSASKSVSEGLKIGIQLDQDQIAQQIKLMKDAITQEKLKLVVDVDYRNNAKNQLAQPTVSTTKGGEDSGEKLKDTFKETSNYAKEVEVIMNRLHLTLDKIVDKQSKKNMDGFIPVDKLRDMIDFLGKSGASLKDIRLESREIQNLFTMWGLALKDGAEAVLQIDSISEKTKNTFKEQLKQTNETVVEYKKEKITLEELIALKEKELQVSKEKIKMMSEYNSLSEKEKTRINKELDSIQKLNVHSPEGLYKEYDRLNSKLVDVKKNLEDRAVDKLASSYNKLGGTIQNLVVRYASLQLVLHQAKQIVQDSIQYVFEMDEAYTDVAISMDITRQEFNKWTEDAQEIARANGVATTSVMDMVKIYATAGEDISAVAEKLNGTAMLQNITQWDADQTTSVVNSIVNQYDLLSKEINGKTGDISNAINYLGDNLIAISNALEIDNVKGIQEMASAIDDSGSVIKNAGGSMEWFMSVTGTLAERMNATGSEVGAAMRMVTARTLQQKQAIEELDGSIEDVDLVMANAEKALNSIGVTIRGSGGDLRAIEDILGDVAGKWDTLSDSTRGYVSAMLAGTNRRSY